MHTLKGRKQIYATAKQDYTEKFAGIGAQTKHKGAVIRLAHVKYIINKAAVTQICMRTMQSETT